MIKNSPKIKSSINQLRVLYALTNNNALNRLLGIKYLTSPAII